MGFLDRYTERAALCSLDHCIAGLASRSWDRYTERTTLCSLDHCIAGLVSRSWDRYTERAALCFLDHCIAGLASRFLDRYTERAALCSLDHCIAAVASPLLDRSILRKPSLRFVAPRSWPKENFAPGSRCNEGRVISHDFPTIRELPGNCRIR